MLQFIAKQNEKYSIPELVQMAIEGGCKWVQLSVDDLDDGQIRELVSELVPLCKETSTILTIENHVELAKEMGIHGVLLKDNFMSAIDARELCGPEAIIGVEVSTAASAVPLRNLDVDFVSFLPNMPVERISENVEAIRNAEVMLPLVAAGDYHFDEIDSVIATRVNGIALGDTIANAKDPVDMTSEIIELITSKNK